MDGYYQNKRLVIEYHELQYSQSVKFWNKITACGRPRDEQRRLYDQTRDLVLKENGIKLLVIESKRFAVNSRGRLRRIDKDRDMVRDLLREFLD